MVGRQSFSFCFFRIFRFFFHFAGYWKLWRRVLLFEWSEVYWNALRKTAMRCWSMMFLWGYWQWSIYVYTLFALSLMIILYLQCDVLIVGICVDASSFTNQGLSSFSITIMFEFIITYHIIIIIITVWVNLMLKKFRRLDMGCSLAPGALHRAFPGRRHWTSTSRFEWQEFCWPATRLQQPLHRHFWRIKINDWFLVCVTKNGGTLIRKRNLCHILHFYA